MQTVSATTSNDHRVFDQGVAAYHLNLARAAGNPYRGSRRISRKGYIWMAGWDSAYSLEWGHSIAGIMAAKGGA